MPKPKAETINRALAIAAQLADSKTQHQAAASSTPSALNHHHSTKFNADTIAMAQSQAHQRPPITCHVLDTTTGRPAAGLPVTLTLLSPSKSPAMAQLSATTNGDGRVAAWTTAAAAAAAATPSTTTSLEALFGRGDNNDDNNNKSTQGGEKEPLVFALRFETGAYWESRGVAAFFPEVEVRFVVRARDEHYHVPLLLGPFNYTTYRGS